VFNKGTPTNRKRLYEAISQGSDAIIIVSYETLRTDLNTRFSPKNIDVLIADEVHRLRNHKTKQSKALYSLALSCKNIFALTGTPAVNHPADVYGILKLLKPKKYASYWQFVERYFTVLDGHFGKQILDVREDRLQEFTNLLADISVNRKRREVMQWIPKITQRTIELDFDTKQNKHYKRALKELVYGLEGEEKDIPNTLAQLTRLRQICVDPGLLELDGKSPKTDFIKEFLDDNSGSVIIFSSFTSYLNNLARVVDSSALLTGEQTQAEKQKAIDLFQSGGKRVLLANIKAGGVGFTLDRADTIIFADRSYNPVDNEQAADRFVPTRSDVKYGAKQIIDLTIADSIEVGINRLLKEKKNIISYVNNYIDNLGVKLGVL
jgi:SNF2 family DNA or RNA helicase